MGASFQKDMTMHNTVERLTTVLKDPGFAAQLNIKFKEMFTDEEGLVFHFYHGATLTSWGEQIYVRLTQIDAVSTAVTVFSQCDIAEQEIDCGKNKKNVAVILAQLAEAVSKLGVPVIPAPVIPAPAENPAPVYGRNFCTNCGSAVKPENKFCTNCGMQL